MGDRDTREDAVRLATEAAKRDALEQVATYLESVTVVEGTDVTRDEIHTYTAGLVLVLDQHTTLTLDGDTVVVRVDLTSQVDTDEAAQAIAALRKNEDARHRLVALKQENEQLQQELDTANHALADASTTDQVQLASQQRQDILNRVQSNAMVSQAWTDWVLVGPVAYPYGWVGGAQTLALLNAARGLSPNSPHVQTAQQVMTARQPPIPSAPLPSVPSHTLVPQPRSRPIPRRLHEVTRNQPNASPQIGNQPTATHPSFPMSASRSVTDIRQFNPQLPVPAQQVPLSPRSARALQQFQQPPQTAAGPSPGAQPPAARRLPPTLNQQHYLPRAPSRIAPRGFGGGGGMGGRGGFGGGRGGGGARGGGGGRGR